MKTLLLSLVLLPAWAATALAGEPDPEQIPAGARWLAYVDVRAALQSRLVQGIVEQEAGIEINGEDWEEIKKLGIDPNEDIHSVTVFGTTDDPEEAVALIATNSKIEGLIGMANMHMQHSTVDVGGLSLDRWSDGGHDAVYAYTARRSGSDSRLLMVSAHSDQLAKAILVIRGQAASLADDEHPAVKTTPSAGAFVYLSASKSLIDLAGGGEPASQVARLVQSVGAEVGERGDNTFLSVGVTTASPDDAQQVVQILQGARSLIQLIAQSEPDAEPFLPMLEGLSFAAKGPAVRLSFEQETDMILRMIAEANGHHDGWGHEEDDWSYEHEADDEPKATPSKTGWY